MAGALAALAHVAGEALEASIAPQPCLYNSYLLFALFILVPGAWCCGCCLGGVCSLFLRAWLLPWFTGAPLSRVAHRLALYRRGA